VHGGIARGGAIEKRSGWLLLAAAGWRFVRTGGSIEESYPMASKKLDEQAVRHVAHLARLKVSEAEVRLFAEQLSTILDYVEQLGELDTDDVPPTAHPLPLSNVFREDAVRDSRPAEEALSNAPDRKDAFFKVPKVIDQNSA
jgi:aspartyl-tRNA(Asn)/glutamyl-tRNA(Gln) amidotransferase subunit C